MYKYCKTIRSKYPYCATLNLKFQIFLILVCEVFCLCGNFVWQFLILKLELVCHFTPDRHKNFRRATIVFVHLKSVCHSLIAPSMEEWRGGEED